MLYLIHIKLKIMIHAKKSLKIFFISVLLVLLSCSESENLQKMNMFLTKLLIKVTLNTRQEELIQKQFLILRRIKEYTS